MLYGVVLAFNHFCRMAKFRVCLDVFFYVVQLSSSTIGCISSANYRDVFRLRKDERAGLCPRSSVNAAGRVQPSGVQLIGEPAKDSIGIIVAASFPKFGDAKDQRLPAWRWQRLEFIQEFDGVHFPLQIQAVEKHGRSEEHTSELQS